MTASNVATVIASLRTLAPSHTGLRVNLSSARRSLNDRGARLLRLDARRERDPRGPIATVIGLNRHSPTTPLTLHIVSGAEFPFPRQRLAGAGARIRHGSSSDRLATQLRHWCG